MTDAELERLARLADAATPGPWRAYCRDIGNPTNDPSWPRENFLQFEIEGPEAPMGRGDFYGPDAALIAASREAIPALIAEITRLSGRAVPRGVPEP